jgi:hypothetical protein
MSSSRLYQTWQNMKSRCYYKKDRKYKNYGGRGITICDKWLNNFEAFRDWALSNGYTDNLTLDRINPDGNYCPENCRFITIQEQARNRTRKSKYGTGIKKNSENSWTATMMKNGIVYKEGPFKTQEEAVEAHEKLNEKL